MAMQTGPGAAGGAFRDELNPRTAASTAEPDEPLDEDFQFVLGELLNAYKPVLEADLQRANSPDALIKEALANPPSCEDEFAQATALFDRFTSEAVATRLLPASAREILGPPERWRWCLAHLRCCIIFGWLLCRGPRTFRGSIYYLYRYWRCVREALGAPVQTPPTAAEREDFATLVKAMAAAYRPYLNDQLATVEFTQALPDEIFSGALDCFEGQDAAIQILDRALTTDTAPALLGKELIAKYRAGAVLLVLPLLVPVRDPLRLLPRARAQPARRVPLPALLPPLPARLHSAAALRDHGPVRLRTRRDRHPGGAHPRAGHRRCRGLQLRALRHRGPRPGERAAVRQWWSIRTTSACRT